MENRKAAGDPRPSLEERYGTKAGYVCLVTSIVNKDVRNGFLLVADAQTLINDANGSNMLSGVAPTQADNQRAAHLCDSRDAQSLNATGRQH